VEKQHGEGRIWNRRRMYARKAKHISSKNKRLEMEGTAADIDLPWETAKRSGKDTEDKVW